MVVQNGLSLKGFQKALQRLLNTFEMLLVRHDYIIVGRTLGLHVHGRENALMFISSLI